MCEHHQKELVRVMHAAVTFEGDHLIWQVVIAFEGRGSAQTFAPCFGSKQQAELFGDELARALGFASLSTMVGSEVLVLRPFGFGDFPEGFENTHGRFTRYEWCLKHYPHKAVRPDLAKKEQLLREIAHAEWKISECKKEVEKIDRGEGVAPWVLELPLQ